jgi:Type IV secretion system pilin
MNRIKNLFLAFVATLTFAMPALVPATVGAASIKEGIEKGCQAVESDCKAGSDATGTDTIKPIIGKVVDFLAYAIGALAIFMVIYGGFRYMMSGGDSGKVTESKNTILYALLGLAVVIFAKTLVGFAIGAASK